MYQYLRAPRVKALSLLTLGFVVLSACQTTQGTQYQSIGVEIPTFEASNKLRNKERPRLKVAKIDVIAPNKGSQLFRQGARIDTYYQGSHTSTQRHRANYKLESDFEREIRRAAEVLFEIDPSSDQSAKIEVAVSWTSSMGSNFLCRHWITTTGINLRVVIEGNKLEAKEGNFDASVDETFCTSFGLFPTGDAVGANIDEALHLALEKAAAAITPAINANPGSTAKTTTALKTVRANSLLKPAQKLSGKVIAVTGPHREHFHKIGGDSCKLEIEIRETSQDLTRTMLQNTFEDAEIVESSIKIGESARVIEIFMSKYKAKGSCRSGICEIEINTDFEYRPTPGAEAEKITEKTEEKAAARSCIDAQYRFDQAT
ncbi:MAG: hypothetical protein CMM59_11530 [Rhodospirillaceae bacterium]|nr:hypothetical protein [Rhodospirillaceae bacterium]